MKRALPLLLAAACAAPGWPDAWRHYVAGIDARQHRPRDADAHFARARDRSGTALAAGLGGPDGAACASVYIRSCIELDDVAAAEEAIARHAPDLGPDARVNGDVAALALLRGAYWRNHAAPPDPDRAVAAYADAGPRVVGLRAKAMLDKHRVDALTELARRRLQAGETDPARAAIDAAIEACRAHLDRRDPFEAEFKARLAVLEELRK
jgi:hypothetical protein